MNAEEFLKNKGIGKPTIKAVRLPHKYKNIELELIPLMEEYAKLKLLGIANVSDLLIAWEQFKKTNWWESDAVDVEKVLMDKFQVIYGR